MEAITVSNHKTAQGETVVQGDNSFVVKKLTPENFSKCKATYVEVDPGKFAYSYHYHEVNEEIFYVISGKGTVKTPKGDVEVEAGSAICFAPNPAGAHYIRNDSKTEKLIYIDYGTSTLPEKAHLLDKKTCIEIDEKGAMHFTKDE